MATSPNFNWPEPDNTDLVKNGALAIRTAVDAIDSSLVDLKGGTTGQVLSKASGTDMDFTWVAQDDSNAIQNAIVDAKGDLIAATADNTPARLAVGGNNTFLRANSSAATGLEWAGAYTTYTPTSAGGWTLGNGTATGRYIQIGKMVHFTATITLGTTSVIAGAVFIDFPVTAQTANNNQPIGNSRCLDSGVQAFDGQIAQNSGTNFIVTLTNNFTSYSQEGVYTATIPFTWGTGDIIWVCGTYEAA
jgi:hypothetical protein